MNIKELAKLFAQETDEQVIFEELKKLTASKTKSEPSAWASKAAKEEAEKFELTVDDFPEIERTGRVLKSGFVQICIHDIRVKSKTLDNLGSKAFSSMKAYELASENDLTPSSFNKKGRINIKDVKELMEKSKYEAKEIEEVVEGKTEVVEIEAEVEF